MSIKFQSSVIFVKDIKTSRQFYEKLLEQQVEMDFGPNVGFVGRFAIWQVEHAYQMIFERALEDNRQLGRENLELYFESNRLPGQVGHNIERGTNLLTDLQHL